MFAASVFLSRGYQVYFPSAQQSWVDFIVEKDGVFQKVQVKTAWWNTVGKNSYLQCRIRSTNKYYEAGVFDILCIVHEGTVWLIPADKVQSSNISLAGTHEKYKGSEWDIYKLPLTTH